MRWPGHLLCWILLGLPAAVHADAAERARIAVERQRLVEIFAQQERDCQQRFAVTDCVENVRRSRRDALEPLRVRELELDDADRQRRAAERRATVEARQRDQAARPVPAAPPEPPSRPPAGPASATLAATPAASTAPAARPSAARAQAQEARAAERARASQRRREDADAALERVRKRVAERDAAGKAAAPLPVPDAARAPAR